MSALTQNSIEWLEFRKTKVGASDAPIIMEISPWKTPYQLWEEKLGIRETFTTGAMQRGTNMEEEARQAFEQETGIAMFPMVKIHPENDWMIASLDGIDIEEKHIVEIKCPGKEDHFTAVNNMVPDKYYPQLQHQLAVTYLEKAYYFSYTRSGTALVVVERDDKFISKMIKKEKEFYDCMMEFVPPKLIDRDFIQRDDLEWQEISSLYLDVQNQLKFLEEQEKLMKDRLISLAGRSNARGSGIKLSKVVRKGAVDYQMVPELKGINLEKYRKPAIETWRILSESTSQA